MEACSLSPIGHGNRMEIVNPNDRTTLLLSFTYEPMTVITARAAIHHQITRKGKGIDSHGILFEFGQESTPYPNNPVLRSAHDVHIVPTVMICSAKFIPIHRNPDRYLTIREIYNLYKGVCQYCLKKISLNEATRDHHYPKSLGGTNHDFNLVLACKKCNCIKDSLYPYRNVRGELVKPKILNKVSKQGSLIGDSTNFREEWKPFLFN